jgi:hypothetical protein
MKQKKGMMFEFIMFFVILIALTSAFLALHKKHSLFEDVIGEKQFALLHTYQQGEKTLFYIDQSAKYAAYGALYELGQRGGLVESECGDYFGYAVWVKMEDGAIRECYPEKEEIEKSFEKIFNEKLDKYLEAYPDAYIPLDNYKLKLEGNLDITGLAVSNLEIPVGNLGAEVDEAELSTIIELEGKEAKLAEEPTTTKPSVKVSRKYTLKGYSRPAGAVVDRIILHHSGDDAAAKTHSTLSKRKLSVHYIIDRDGTIYYLVDEKKMALHAKGWNARSIGIELVNTGHKEMEFTPNQYNSLNKLIDDIAARWPSIKKTNTHIIGHYEASESGKWDPSPNFDWTKIGLAGHITLAEMGKNPPPEFGYPVK